MPDPTRELVDSLLQTRIVRTFAPATERDIRLAVRTLGVPFPDSYRDFLLTCGTMLIGTLEQPRPVRAPLYKFPSASRLDRAGLGWPNDPIHDRFVFGLGKDTERRSLSTESVVFQTLVGRASYRTKLAAHLVPIWDDWHYEFHCLDTSRIKSGDCPIMAFARSSFRSDPPKPAQVAKGFDEWLRALVKKQLRMKARVDKVLKATAR